MGGDVFGGLQIAIDQRRRHGETIADVREAFAGRAVRGELLRRVEIDAGEIAERVRVFGVVEPAENDPSRIAVPPGRLLAEQAAGGPEQTMTCRSSVVGCGFSFGGISPASTCSTSCSHGWRSAPIACRVTKRSRSRSPRCFFVEWHSKQYFARIGRTLVGVVVDRAARLRSGDERMRADHDGDGEGSERRWVIGAVR